MKLSFSKNKCVKKVCILIYRWLNLIWYFHFRSVIKKSHKTTFQCLSSFSDISKIWQTVISCFFKKWNQNENNFGDSATFKGNSVQEAFTKCFAFHKLQFCKQHEKTEQKAKKKGRFVDENWKLSVWCFIFFMWFARFQILICELQITWRKLLVLSWL